MAKRRKKLIVTVESPVLSGPFLSIAGSAHAVEELRKKFQAGNDRALLDAVDFCARAGMAIPEPLASAFCERYLKWHLFKARTLDEAFKVKRPKGARLKDRAKREALKLRVVLAVLRRVKRGRPIDEYLFELVGRQLGIKGSLAKDIFYDKSNRWREFFEIWPPKKF